MIVPSARYSGPNRMGKRMFRTCDYTPAPELCSWCDAPSTVALGTNDSRCAKHDAIWFGDADDVHAAYDAGRVAPWEHGAR